MISAISVADVWEEIRVAVEALLFDAASGPDVRPTQPSSASVLPSGGSGRAYSRVGQDGRRLIINPIAGTITVSAFPAQLEQLDIFIRAFEASIQRQVLIEAKIVEVNLDRTFQFGIDWNVLARAGTASLNVTSHLPTTTPRPPGSAPTGNVEFTLTGEPPNPRDVPSGCRFRTRCPLVQDVCAREEPPLRAVASGLVACHFA